MSVNVSRKQLVRRDIADEVARVVRETGIRPRCLKVEITESSMMSDTRAALDALRAIRALDVQLHVDDFGTGYSSLSCLQTFPVDGLKIDRSFVSEILEKPQQAALLKAIVAMAHGMGMPLVTEGVETAEQAAVLKAMGCDFAQGYLFAKPMSPADASEYVARQCAAAAAQAA